MVTETLRESEKRGHEQVTFFYYPEVGLKAIIAIHNTVLGPSLGGCRLRLYASESEALEDAMRLSEGMTYKNSVAGLDIGGGKSCIIADPAMIEGRQALFEKFGECVNNLNGRYITAEDMGTSVRDIMHVKKHTNHVAGVALEDGGGGDPSPWTARGLYKGILAACEHRYGSNDLKDKHVALQGVGHVGMYALKYLQEAGAKVTVCDTNESLLTEASQKYGANIVDKDAIYDVECDIYAPCAVGQTVNQSTIGRLKCDIIAGAANNQLSDSTIYKEITSRKILYCPDFVINAGGVINCASEYQPGGWNEAWTAAKVDRIFDTIHNVLTRSEKENKFSEVVALEMARERIAEKKAGK